MEGCPCKNCICVPICRHKPYSFLIQECDLVYNYLSDSHFISGISAPLRRMVFESLLQPTTWKVNDEGYLIGRD